MKIFIEVEKRKLGLVAWFRDRGYYKLDKRDLLMRIENLKKQGQNIIEEEKALKALEEVK